LIYGGQGCPQGAWGSRRGSTRILRVRDSDSDACGIPGIVSLRAGRSNRGGRWTRISIRRRTVTDDPSVRRHAGGEVDPAPGQPGGIGSGLVPSAGLLVADGGAAQPAAQWSLPGRWSPPYRRCSSFGKRTVPQSRGEVDRWGARHHRRPPHGDPGWTPADRLGHRIAAS
jgi:hypothetical protein